MPSKFLAVQQMALVWVLVLAPAVAADVKLPAILTDNMVIQQGAPVIIWGWADAGEKVEVTIGQSVKASTPDANGRWETRFEPMRPGKPFDVIIAAKNTVTLTNVVVGEVWICSGQSNMRWPVFVSNNAQQELAAANYPEIRLFLMPDKFTAEPLVTLEGQQQLAATNVKWQACTPQSVHYFSAVAYFFGRDLHKQLDVPVGLVCAAMDGTLAESWTSIKGLQADPALKPLVEKFNPDEISQFSPATLYNGMIAPLIPFGIRGVAWYQGEYNASRAHQYQKLLPALINDWRRQWGRGDFPFLIVQLANFGAQTNQPAGDSEWAELREAQFMAAQNVANAELAVAIDIGLANNIHPGNKQDVGKRLMLAALGKVYGKEIVSSGPIYDSSVSNDGKITLSFQHVGSGLVAGGTVPLKGFAIAGKDQHFVWAEATIEGKTVVVSSDQVPEPVAVRYAWADNPDCNLYNKEGLPASPFRTDAWRGKTFNTETE